MSAALDAGRNLFNTRLGLVRTGARVPFDKLFSDMGVVDDALLCDLSKVDDEVELISLATVVGSKHAGSMWDNSQAAVFMALFDAAIQRAEKAGEGWNIVLDAIVPRLLEMTHSYRTDSEEMKLHRSVRKRVEQLWARTLQALEPAITVEDIKELSVFAYDPRKYIATWGRCNGETVEWLSKNYASDIMINPNVDVEFVQKQWKAYACTWVGSQYSHTASEEDNKKISAFEKCFDNMGPAAWSGWVLDILLNSTQTQGRPINNVKGTLAARLWLDKFIAMDTVSGEQISQLLKCVEHGDKLMAGFWDPRMEPYRQERWDTYGRRMYSYMITDAACPIEWLRKAAAHIGKGEMDSSKNAPHAKGVILHAACDTELALSIARRCGAIDVKYAMARRGWEQLDADVWSGIANSSSVDVLTGLIEGSLDSATVDKAIWKLAAKDTSKAIEALLARENWGTVSLSRTTYTRLLGRAIGGQREQLVRAMGKLSLKNLDEVDVKSRRRISK